MSLSKAIDFLNTLVDDSAPDIDLDQLQHLLQTSEAIREEGYPDWFVLTSFSHDIGKVLCLFDKLQRAEFGDTFPVGRKFSETIAYPEFFKENADFANPKYHTKYGVYSPN